MNSLDAAILAIDGVSHGYGSGGTVRQVLDGASLTIDRGERVGLAGPSGAGKSTLARIASLVEAPTSGRVLLGGQAVDGASHDVSPAQRRRVQLLWQAPRPAVDPRYRLAGAILEPMRIHGQLPRGQAARHALAVELATEVGLTPDLLTRRTNEVSDGQLQRACLARSLSLHPEVLIADEPGAMLDVSTQAALLGVIGERVDRGMGVLLISHDTALLSHWCDRVLWLRDGQLRDQP